MSPGAVSEFLCTHPLLDQPLLPLRCRGSVKSNLALGEVLPALSLLVQGLVHSLVRSAQGRANNWVKVV